MLAFGRHTVVIGLLVALSAGATHLALRVWQAPRTVMSRLETAVAEAAGGYNRCLHRRSLELRQGGIRRPNPDVLPTTVAYDLSDGALQLAGPLWSGYWSLSVYQHNSDNVFVVNDREFSDDTFNIVVSREPLVLPDGARNIVSPTMRGLVVIRRLVPGPDSLPALRRNQDQMSCVTITPDQELEEEGLSL